MDSMQVVYSHSVSIDSQTESSISYEFQQTTASERAKAISTFNVISRIVYETEHYSIEHTRCVVVVTGLLKIYLIFILPTYSMCATPT